MILEETNKYVGEADRMEFACWPATCHRVSSRSEWLDWRDQQSNQIELTDHVLSLSDET